MGSKPKAPKQKTENYLNMESYRNAPWVKSNVAAVKGVDVGELIEVTELEALQYGGGIPVNCIEIYFNDLPPLLLTDHSLDVTYNSFTYQSYADLQTVSATTQNRKINTQGGRVVLSGVDSSFFNVIEEYKAVRARVQFNVALLDDQNNCLAMFIEHRGYISLPTTTFDESNGSIEIEFETTNVFEHLDGVAGDRPCDAIQQSYWPGDTSFTHVTVTEDEEWRIKQT